MIRAILVAIAILLVPRSSALAETAPKNVSVVLVHGAFVDGSGWQEVHDLLVAEGYDVLVVQNPTIDLQGDVETTTRTIARASHPVILVGHSYGGMVITEAGDDPKVRSLVYVAAYMPDIGESAASINGQYVPAERREALVQPLDDYLIIDPAKFPTEFAGGVDPATAKFMAAAQVPFGVAAVQAKATRTAWKSKPSHYLVTANDHIIPPAAQREMAKRAGARAIEVPSGHAVMLSHPADVAAFISTVAGASD